MRRTGQMAMYYRDDEHKGIKQTINRHNGQYANYDAMVNEFLILPYYGLQLYTGDFADYHMSGREYTDMVKNLYFANVDSINALDVPHMIKESRILSLQDNVLEAMGNYKYFLGHNYRNVKNIWRTSVPVDSIPAVLTNAEYAEVATWFDVNNPKILVAEIHREPFDWNKFAGVKGDLHRSLELFAKGAGQARALKLDPAVADSLKSLSNPFFAQAVDSIAARAARSMAELYANEALQPTPKVADNKVFDAIIAPHKGKVVVVDLWNTWCAPCRAALANNEPLKSGELSNDDIVWIYIADESSNPVKYLEMIPEIKGLHYKLNESQINAIRDRFNVDGIPYYILVDRHGNAQGRPDIRDHSKYISEIKSKL